MAHVAEHPVQPDARAKAFNELHTWWAGANSSFDGQPLTEREQQLALGAMAAGWNGGCDWVADRVLATLERKE